MRAHRTAVRQTRRRLTCEVLEPTSGALGRQGTGNGSSREKKPPTCTNHPGQSRIPGHDRSLAAFLAVPALSFGTGGPPSLGIPFTARRGGSAADRQSKTAASFGHP